MYYTCGQLFLAIPKSMYIQLRKHIYICFAVIDFLEFSTTHAYYLSNCKIITLKKPLITC